MPITTIGLDADDTLWHNETIFRLTHDRFADLLSEHHDRDRIEDRLAATEQRNLRLYGYGVKGFTLSMIETAMELTDGEPPPRVISEILAAGREMLSHPVETLPGGGRDPEPSVGAVPAGADHQGRPDGPGA